MGASSLAVFKARLDGALGGGWQWSPDLVVGSPAHSRGLGVPWSLWSHPTQAILWFTISGIMLCFGFRKKAILVTHQFLVVAEQCCTEPVTVEFLSFWYCPDRKGG